MRASSPEESSNAKPPDGQDNVTEVLMKQFKFQEWHAKDASRRLMRDRKILDDFLTYSRTHQLPILSVRKDGGADEYTVLGYTVTKLMRDYDLAPVGAFLMLSELSSNPEEGKMILQQMERHG